MISVNPFRCLAFGWPFVWVWTPKTDIIDSDHEYKIHVNIDN